MKTLNDLKKELMKDKDFKAEYEAIQPEMDVIRALIDARIASNLTQKQLAELSGVNQSDISKIENGTRNPSIRLLQKLAAGMNMSLKLQFIPSC
ncbi:MAG: helix-turn-helix domain-containing protein [Selenomonadales bacterium]|nr:helix-turn-helix domain-containing protein [Selenomonadales bacterium]MDY3738983.1 helix-turn-helix transcriptional regulator [Selenomonadaceae bacterium]